MKTTIFILNWLIVCACCLICAMLIWAALDIVPNLVPDLMEGRSVPSLTSFCFNNMWILWAIPVAWAIPTIFLFVKNCTFEKILLHSVAGVFLGLMLICIHLRAGLLLYVTIRDVGMAN